MVNTNLLKLVGLFLVLSWSHSGHANHVDQGVTVGLDPVGLDMVSRKVSDSALKDIVGQPLDDVDDTLDNGVQVKVRGLKLWVDFDRLQLTSREGVLRGVVRAQNIRVYAESMQLRKKVLGNWVSTTCYETNLEIGDGSPVNLTLDVAPSVTNRAVRLADRGVDFRIRDDQYEVDGPDRCSGALGVGELIRMVVHSILDDQKGEIESSVKREVSKAVPELADNLSQQITRTFQVRVENVTGLPPRVLRLQMFPTSVVAKTNRLELVAGIEPFRGSIEGINPTALAETNETSVGELGFNPFLVTETFQFLYPDGSDYVELMEDSTPGLSEILDVNSAAGIWPDLNEINLTRDKLRVKVRLVQTPQLKIEGGVLKIEFPQIEFLFMAHIDNSWVDYFQMFVRLDGEGTVVSQRAKILVSLVREPGVSVWGDWAAGYEPSLDMFEADVATFLISSVTDYLYASGPVARLDTPPIVVGGQALSIGEVRIFQPYLLFNLEN